MKNSVIQLFVIAFILFLFNACTEDRDERTGKSDSLVMIDAGLSTKAVDANWEPDDVIGVTMYDPAYTAPVDGIYNSRYITQNSSTTGYFEPATEDEKLYFPQDGSEIRLKAYYPYQTTLNESMLLPWRVVDQTVLQSIDLMTAVHQDGFSKAKPSAQLHFYHRLSKLIFRLSVQDGDDFVDPSECRLTIRNAELGNTYDLLHDRFLDASLGEGDIVVSERPGEPGDFRQAIVMPRPAGSGYIFEFTSLAGDTYTAEMASDMALEGGMQYTFDVIFAKNYITISATIEPWVVREPITYETLQVATPAGESEGVNIGDVMNVYLQNEESTDFNLLRTFTYESVNNWVPDAPVYWEDIEQDPAIFHASILAQQPLNTTQLGDILIADELPVARNTGAGFIFRHAASKVIVGLTSDTFTGQDLNGATITLPNYLTGGYEEKGVFIPGTQRMNILVDRTDLAAGVALFQPQTIDPGNPLLTVTINGRDYEVDQPDGFTFEAGIAYQILVTVHKEALTVSVTVVDWTNQTLNLDAVTVGTAVSGAEGVRNGEVLQLYAGNETSRTLLNAYTYYAALDSFSSPFPLYWESLDDPTTFYGAILRTPAYNNTQLDDYLLSDATPVPASYGVDLSLKHVISRVVVQLRSTDETFSDAELANMTITLPDYITGGAFNNGVFVPGSTQGDILVANNVGDNNNSNIAHIQPQTVMPGNTVVRIQSPNGRTYTATYPDPVVYADGQSTDLYVEMSKTGVTLSAEVTPWTSQTISMVATGITLNSVLGTTDDDFQDKSIYIFGLDPVSDYTIYTYRQVNGVYQWAGDNNYYWDDIAPSSFPLRLPAVHYPANPVLPATGQTTFTWNIGADQTDPANGYYDNYDLLMSNNINLMAPDNLNFRFEHVLSQVEVNIRLGTGFTTTEVQGATVTLPGYRLSGTANLTSATVTAGNGVATVTPRTITDGVQYMALVMPQTKGANTNIVSITLNEYPDTPFIGRLPNNQILTFIAGRRTIINVTLEKTAIQLSATLADWQTGDRGDITIQ